MKKCLIMISKKGKKMFIKKVLKLSIFLSMMSSVTYAENSTIQKEASEPLDAASLQSSESNQTVLPVEPKLSLSQKTKILMDEKRRLRSIVERREPNQEIILPYFYIDQLKNVDDLTKGMLRENVFYTQYILKNKDNKENLETETENYLWNIYCLSNNLTEEQYFVMMPTLNRMILDSEEKEKDFDQANQVMMNKIGTMSPITREEIKIRCLDVYGKN